MPSVLFEANVCDAVIKLIKRNYGHGPAMYFGCQAISLMSVDVNINERYGVLAACDCVPQAMKIHQDDPNVMRSGCEAIATLALFVPNRIKFCSTGACEIVVIVIWQMWLKNAV
jgi:hypothetical protein